MWHTMVVHPFTQLTWSNTIHALNFQITIQLHPLTKSTLLALLSMNTLKNNTSLHEICLKKIYLECNHNDFWTLVKVCCQCNLYLGDGVWMMLWGYLSIIIFFPFRGSIKLLPCAHWVVVGIIMTYLQTKRFPTKCAINLPFNQNHQFFHSLSTHVVLDKMIMNVKRCQTCGQHSRCNIYRSTHIRA